MPLEEKTYAPHSLKEGVNFLPMCDGVFVPTQQFNELRDTFIESKQLLNQTKSVAN